MNDKKPKKESTSWGKVASWYDDHLEGEQNYFHKEIILPNLRRLLDPKAGEKIMDLASGTGFFVEALAGQAPLRQGYAGQAEFIGVEISPELVVLSKKKNIKNARFFVSPSHKLDFIPNSSIDKIIFVLAIQNILKVPETLAECARALKPSGKFFIVMNHPAFRIPKKSFWGFDEKFGIQYRRVDEYLSESRAEIEMNPGKEGSNKTISFHRPLQYYFKALQKAGFVVSRLEEWNSDKKSLPGPRASAENKARKEIPVFMMLEAKKAI